MTVLEVQSCSYGGFRRLNGDAALEMAITDLDFWPLLEVHF